MKVLIDTNVIIDALTGREPFRESAEQIFMLAANQLADMYITASSVTDIYYLIRKYLHSTKQAKGVLSKLFELFNILDVSADDCRIALVSNVADYEDAVLMSCAQRNRMEYIVTRNIKDYAQSNVPAILPDDFMKTITKVE